MNDIIELTDDQSNVSMVPTATVPTKAQIDAAQFPARYVAAQLALRHCLHVDEAKELHSQWDAMCTYAKQAEHTELEQLALAIRLRAERRLGELLRQISQPPVAPTPKAHAAPAGAGARPTDTTDRRQRPGKGQGLWAQAANHNLPKELVSRALTFAAVPAAQFDQLVEQRPVPGRQQLADQLRRTTRKPTSREGWSTRRLTLSVLRDFDQFWDAHPAAELAPSFDNAEAREAAIALVHRIQKSLASFVEALQNPVAPELPLAEPVREELPPEPTPQSKPTPELPPEPVVLKPPVRSRAPKKKMQAKHIVPPIRDYTRHTVRGESNSLAFFCNRYRKDYGASFALLKEGWSIEQALGLKPPPKSKPAPIPPFNSASRESG